MSNKFIQVRFKDRTELFIDTQKRLVYFLNKDCEVVKKSMQEASESDNEMLKKRYRYAQEVLTRKDRKDSGNDFSRKDTPTR